MQDIVLYAQPELPLAPLLTPVIIAMSLWLNRPKGPGPRWSDLAFIYGRWRIDRVKTGHDWRPARGTCDISALEDGQVLTRRNRGWTQDDHGRRRPACDPVLRIFYDRDALKADYAIEGEVIRFSLAAIHEAREVVFTATPRPDGPVFRLRYQRVDKHTLASELALAAPGACEFHPVMAEALSRRR